jgi:hypothetical protein
MAFFSRNPHKHWVKPRLLKNKVAKSGYTKTHGQMVAIMSAKNELLTWQSKCP